MKSKISALFVGIIALTVAPHIAQAHCQIPCGIYNDAVRITLMKEHISTIEKSMRMINELQQAGTNPNQLVRWVNNKEHHAEALTKIITAYFMTQRIKPALESNDTAFQIYQNRVIILHRMLIETMKAKQTTDHEPCIQLRSLIEAFEKVYPTQHEH